MYSFAISVAIVSSETIATLTAKLQNAVTQATTNEIFSAAGTSNLC